MLSQAAETTVSYATPPLHRRPSGFLGLSGLAWTTIVVVALLVAALYWPNLRRLWEKTNLIYGVEHANWAHSTLVPVIGLIYLWMRREDLYAARVEPVLPRSRFPWLLGGGAVLMFAGAIGWLFAEIANLDLGIFEVALIPAMVAGLVMQMVDLGLTWAKAGPAGAGRVRVLVGTLSLLVGVAGWAFMGTPLAERVFGSTPAGYAGPALLAFGLMGGLSILLDWGLGTLLSGMLLSGYGIWPGQNDYVKDVGMVLTIFGATLTLAGWSVMRIAWFPILFLICAIPWPALVYSQVALPLQFLAAKVAVIVMNVAQVESYVEGTQIILSKGTEEHTLNVAEACAGMRSLMTFITAGGVVGFVLGVDRPMWQRFLILFSAVPIAILCNVGRVSGMGVSYFYVSEAVATGFTHQLVGLLMLIPAFLMLLGVCWVLDNLFVVEEVDDDAGRQDATAPVTNAAPAAAFAGPDRTTEGPMP
jgi:exosortase